MTASRQVILGRFIRGLIAALAVGAAAMLASCGPKSPVGISDSAGQAASSVSIGGAVSGLGGTVVLAINGGETLSISTDGSFSFLNQVASGSSYNVSVSIQPVGQACTVANGVGTASASTTNVAVTCAARTFSVGGAVSGLTGTVVLRINGSNDLSLSTNGPFAFGVHLADRSSYSVTVLTQPAGQGCSVSNGTGTLAGANVADVSVSCAANTFSVGGAVSGLSGVLVLKNNGANNLTIVANGSFAFSAALANGSPYNVTVATQPAGQICTVSNRTGTVSGANVTSVSVTCTVRTFTVGGTVSGLAGTLVLQNNGTNNLSIAGSGGFTFSSALQAGSPYSITVATQPAGQTCTVANGAGTVSGANVTSVAVTCAVNTFSVGGTASGLTGALVLQLNGGNNLSVPASGPFTFNVPLADLSSYSVTVLTQPTGQSCSITGGTGTLAGSGVTNVSISCAANRFTVGGGISGLAGTLVLQDNGTDNLSIAANAAFTFSATLQTGSSYSVTVLTQPTGQVCTVANGAGTVSGAKITNVSVTCTARTFSIGGAVSGLAGTLVLQNNGANNLSIAGDGNFTFAAALQTGSSYSVTVASQPVGQTCTVANGAGTVSGAVVNSVNVTCAVNTFSVGGAVSGLAGTVVLRLNGGNDLAVSASGGFAFGVKLADLSSYGVTVLTQPTGQSCSVANGTGTLAGADVTNVGVSCAANRFAVGGTVSGLSGTLVLQDSGTDDLSIAGSGAFGFSTALQTGSPFSVTVLTQPAGQTCTVANGTGMVSGANVANVSVSCVVNTFTVGGTVAGLSGNLVLRNNGANNLSIAGDGNFVFPTALQPGSAYNVTVATQPAGQTCTVASGTGTVGGANVTSVAVTCTSNTFSVGGAVSGLTGTVVLQINGGNDLGVPASGPFTFNTSLTDFGSYSITVLAQPTGQSCSVANGSGTIAGANVTNVGVSCVANTFTVGGTISGLAGSVVLQLNGGSTLPLSANGTFLFPDAVSNNARYTVAMLTQPSGQTCTVANGAGTVSGANVTNVSVTCATNTFSVGGSVSGLSGTLVLQLNGGNNFSVSANGPFAFSVPLADRSVYSVTILSPPAGQGCSITGGTGTLAGTNVMSVGVSCAANTFTVGGAVSGLSGTLVLRNNGANDLTITGIGAFAFSAALQSGNSYSITVASQPAGQLCTVTNGAGTVGGANVTSVALTCATRTFSVGGTVSGLAGAVVLQLNGGSNLSIPASGPFTFSVPLADLSGYSVTVLTQPAGQGCSVANGTGTISGASITNVSVSCVANRFTVGGTVSGLAGTLVLQDNGTDNLAIVANAAFTFSTALQTGSSYSVTVQTQPVGQTCSVTNALGTVSGAKVTNVSVTCVVNTFTVGGTVSGLAGTLVLRNNGANNLSIAGDGNFTFTAALQTGSPYNVAVATQPAGQTCTVASGAGSVSGANVTSVSVSCAVNTFTVEGTVSGLSGTLVLRDNGANDLTITGSSGFTFTTALANGSAYNVTVASQPAGQTCTVSNGTGTVSGANVTGVGVACSANSAGTITYTANFSGTETPISENGAWQHNGLDWTLVAKAGGFAHGTQAGDGNYDDSYAYLSGFPADQSASATIVLNTSATDAESREVELLLRWSDSAHSATGYEINLHYLGAYAQIVRWNGLVGDFAIIGGVTNLPKPKTGDVMKATVVGNVITVFYNGTQIAQATDSTYATGNPGMGFFIRAPAANTDFGFSSFTASGL